MAIDAEDIAARVAQGAALLDRLRPDWIRMQPWHIQFERLDGGMLTLVWGTFARGVLAIREATGGSGKPFDYGFVGRYEDLEEFEAMNEAWRSELARRKGKAAVR